MRVKEEEVVGEEDIGIEDIKRGDVYELIYTSFESELTRYRIGDFFTCIAKGDDIIGTDYPVFKFRARQKTIALQNFTRINEDELWTVFRKAGMPLADFVASIEIERGMEFLTVYMEHKGDMNVKRVENKVHKELYEMNADYRDLVDFFKYKPVKIKPIPQGVFAKYRTKNRWCTKSR